ncbi:MAG TPA: hypothetical protein VFS43_06410 [Polyangiaceae bacterium]|nr:hypothetical protein [Polyangiaceae bacterium]
MTGALGRGGAGRALRRGPRARRAGAGGLGRARLVGAALATAALGGGGAARAAEGGGALAGARLVRTTAEWREARERWAALGAALAPARTQSVPISTTLRAPALASPLRARGAYAVRPPEGLRLQLVGPAGTLALDVWSGPGAWRMAVPAMGRVERGAPGDERPGRPVGFLRWWLLRPLEGRLLFAGRFEGGDWLFGARSPDGARLWVRAAPDGHTVSVERRRGARVERVRAEGLPCGLARYEDASTGVGVDVRCEGESTEPSPRAFDDPDRAGGP